MTNIIISVIIVTMSEKKHNHEINELNPTEALDLELECRLWTTGGEELVEEKLTELKEIPKGNHEAMASVLGDILKAGYVAGYASSFTDDLNEHEKMSDLLSSYGEVK